MKTGHSHFSDEYASGGSLPPSCTVLSSSEKQEVIAARHFQHINHRKTWCCLRHIAQVHTGIQPWNRGLPTALITGEFFPISKPKAYRFIEKGLVMAPKSDFFSD